MDKYIKVYDWMYEIFGGDMTAVMIYALIYHFTAASGGCHSSYQQIAERLKIGRSTVYRKTSEMVRKGVVIRMTDDILIASNRSQNEYAEQSKDDSTVVKLNTHRSQIEYGTVVKLNTPSRIIKDNQLDNHLYNAQNSEKGEDKEEMPRKKKTDSLTAERLEQAFAEFWTEYPRKVGKATARKAFEKAATDENRIEEIMNGLRRMNAEDFRFRAVNYIPHPSTWLNREGWEDEPTPPTNERAHSTKAAILEDLPF